MVGDAGGPGGPAAGLSAGVRAAYEAAAAMWAEGPEPVYASLARALVACAAEDLAGGGSLGVRRGRVRRGRVRRGRAGGRAGA